MSEFDSINKVVELIKKANPRPAWRYFESRRLNLEDVLVAFSKADIKVDEYHLFGNQFNIFLTDSDGHKFTIYWELHKKFDEQDDIVTARVARALENYL